MILYVKGNLFESPAQTLVNTVNTVGVMGKGVALEFKRLFPEMYAQYRTLCEQRQFDIGQLWLYRNQQKWVLNFPTKRHWRAPSRIEYIEAGLQKFTQIYSEWGIHSIAFPPLGCGNGQLDFETQVQPLMERYLQRLPIDIFIYPQKENPFVEHLNIAEMKRWLRSEPASLPFSEVWDDLTVLLANKSNYETISKGNLFSAAIVQEPQPGIRIAAAGQNYFIHRDALLSFWQQLRTHGFSTRQIAPGLDRKLSYLIPIFSELSYVAPVHVANDYNELNRSTITGLQILPAAISHKIQRTPAQLSLFPV